MFLSSKETLISKVLIVVLYLGREYRLVIKRTNERINEFKIYKEGMYEVERKLKSLLGIPGEETLISLQTYKKKGKTYYRIITYSPKTKGKRRYHISRKIEPEILFLWKEYEKLKNQEKEIKETIEELLRRFQNPHLIKKVVEELLEEGLKKEAKDFAYEKFKNQAIKLFEEFKLYLLELKKNEVSRISILQALYLLANVREMFKEKEEEELKKALKRAVSTIILRDKNQKLQNPFGILKSDFFLPQTTPYDFLLSPFLQEELEPIFEKLLLAELEKQETQEVMAQISEFVASLSDKAKKRILKAFPSISEFSKALYWSWKKSKEDLKEFLTEWKSYLEMEVPKTEEKHIIEFLKSLNRN